MIERELKDITEDVLRGLIAERASEGKTLEFKRALNVSEPEAKLKFLRGVASFANASGGDMIFGMVADNEGKAENLVSLENFNPDRDALRFRDIIRMNIEPRSVFTEFRPVELSTGGHALVLRIRKSWAGAHFVTHKDDHKFFTRDHNGKRMMDVAEIRDAFTLAEGLTERINRFRLERVGNIVADETPEALMSTGRLVLHLCPLSSFQPGKKCDLDPLKSGEPLLRPINADGWSSRHDVEGYYVFQSWGSKRIALSYTLVSHSGWIEAVESFWLRPDRYTEGHEIEGQEHGENSKIVPTGAIEPELIKELATYFKVLTVIGAEAPVVVMLSFLNVKGFIVHLDPMFSNHSARPIGRDNLLIPGSVVDTLDVEISDRTKTNAVDVMRPMFDVLWNACGLPKSRTFDAEGNLARRDRWR